MIEAYFKNFLDVSFRESVEAACGGRMASCATYRIRSAAEAPGPWVMADNEQVVPPDQGWKLHVSATVTSAEEVLQRALPVLVSAGASFKVTASILELAELNIGAPALSQAGKFITIYPSDDVEAVRLAVALDEATRGLPGPAVPTDRPLRQGSLVHYRYGAFRTQYLRTRVGRTLPALQAIEGDLVPDRRGPIYRPPAWAVDPFLQAGVAAPLPGRGLAGGRFLTVATFHWSPSGTVEDAVDIDGASACVLKRARRHAMMRPDGLDARDRLRHEAEVLSLLAPDPRFPTVLDLVEQDGDLLLALERIEGETLERHLGRLATAGIHLSSGQLVVWGRELAQILGTIHTKGFVYRDLKSNNVLITPDGHLCLVDFELAQEPGSAAPVWGLGTTGYMSPQQTRGDPPHFGDDIYGLGALLYYMATEAEPSKAPNPMALLGRPMALLHPSLSPGLGALVARCLELDPNRRFATMREVDEALEVVDAAVVPGPLPLQSAPEAEIRRRCRAFAHRISDTICAVAGRPPNAHGLAWRSDHPVAGDEWPRDLNVGGAGTLLALAELAATFAEPRHREVLAEGARWLAGAPYSDGTLIPGLYVGEAGVAAALLRASQVLGDRDLLATALDRGRWIATLPHVSPDLFNGTAGRLRLHLWLYDETADPQQLGAAVAAGEALLGSARRVDDGWRGWAFPPGYESLSDGIYLGYAHGAAGIADALLDLFEVTQDDRFRVAASGVAAWLAGLAVPALDDGSGLNWPQTESDPQPHPAVWCHGAAGIGSFFAHAARLGIDPEASEFAARAARTAARAARWCGPVQCHGLSGNIEFLLDMYQLTGEPAYLDDARSLAVLLEAFASERDGLLVWSSDTPATFCPDYMVGYAGVAVCLLRLADPESRPRQLSRAGFRQPVNTRSAWAAR